MDDWIVGFFASESSHAGWEAGKKAISASEEPAPKTNSKDKDKDTGLGVSKDKESPPTMGHPKFTLYCYPYSFYSQKIRMIMYEKNLPVHEHMINIHLGEQFADSFLILNPRAEVPVLKDRETHQIIPDSDNITRYLEEKYSGHGRIRKLIPEIQEWKDRNNMFHAKIHSLHVESLTFGIAMFNPSELDIWPKHPYNNERVREQMREIVHNRTAILRTEALRAKDSDPQAYHALTQKLTEAQHEMPRMRDRGEYEKLVLEVERVLDECEMELRIQYQRDPSLWLVCPFITQADVSLAILLYRLWQLGFSGRMWCSGNRQYLKKYFKRMKGVPSFQKVTQLEKDANIWLYVFGGAGAVFLFGVGCYLTNKK